jgi:hypothetical protein
VLAENEVALKTTPTLCKGDSNGHWTPTGSYSRLNSWYN